MRIIPIVLAVLASALATPAAAFCGFYVARADGSLYNKSSKVIYARINDRSAITMSSDYRGPAAEFAMIVPTPYVLSRNAITTVKPATVDHLDAYTAPRLVEYFDYDPCAPEIVEEAAIVENKPVGFSGGREDKSRRDGAKALGVTIEREYAVGAYDILMLSAKDSDGLVTWLTGEGYKLPEGAEGALGGYVQMGMKFFVAKVNLKRHSEAERQELEPLQITFQSKDFMLPIQLGKVNADGPQDLLIMMLTKKGRVELANYPVTALPSDVNVPVFVKQIFPQFYRDMFTKAVGQSGAALEYAWDMAWCDPCAADPLSYSEIKELGVSWVGKKDANQPDIFVTRLHVRYTKASFPNDLMFRETDNRENFQGRYVLNHPYDGEITCDWSKDEFAAEYLRETKKRLKDEAAELRKITGWGMDGILTNIRKTTPARYQ